LVAEGVFCRWEWVDGLVASDHGPFLYTPFSIFGVERLMEVEGFSFPLSALTSHGLFPSFLLSLPFSLFLLTCFSSWSLPSLVIQISLNKFFFFHRPASMTWTCRVLSTLNNFLKNCVS
jgi:hypothetical protein